MKLLQTGTQTDSLEREVALLQRLRHPGLAAVRGYLKDSTELFSENRGPCFWMDWIDGPDLLSAVKESEDPGKAFAWFREALEALAYLHGEKVLHGDLTPGNFKIAPDGRLRILDFGLASLGRTERPHGEGTLFYMAPERFQGIQDESGDLFSLGTVFYEAIAGRHPREGRRSLTDMFRQPTKPLQKACPTLDPRFTVATRVIDALISPQAADRFGSAGEALRALASGTTERGERAGAYHSRIFYGAEGALEAADQALLSVGRKPGFLAVHGGAGSGRTRFLSEVSFRAALAGLRVVDVPPENFPHGTERLLEDAAPAVFLFRGLEEVPLSELSRILGLHRCPTFQGLAVLEWNDDALGEEARRLLLHSPIAARWTDVTLGALDLAQTRDFLDGAIGKAIAGQVAGDLFAATRGHPRLLNDWAAFFREKGWTGKAHFSKDWLAGVAAPWSAETLIRSRLEALAPLEALLAQALAVDGGPAPLEEILEAARAVAGDSAADEDFSWTAVGALDNLIAQGVASADADEKGHAAYRIALKPFARAIAGLLDAGRKRAFHAAWLAALAHAPDASARKIRHLAALNERARFVPAMEILSESLRASERAREALEILEEAWATSDPAADPVSHSRLLRAKTNLLNDLGRYKEALACCEENLKLSAADEPRPLKLAKYWMVTGIIFENLGDRPEALRRFRECLKASEALEGRERDSYRVRSHTLIGKQLLLLGEGSAAVGPFEKARELSSGLVRERAEACRNLAVARAREGRWPEVWALFDEAAALYRSDGYAPGEFGTLLMQGNLSLDAGDPAAAARAYERAEAVAASRRDDLLLARVWNNQGVVARAAGDLARAWDRGQRSLEIFRALGHPGDLAESLKQNAMTAAELGRFEGAEALRAELREMAAADARWKDKADVAGRHLALFQEGEGLPAGADDPVVLGQRLERMLASLPKELQVSFVDRADYRKWVLKL